MVTSRTITIKGVIFMFHWVSYKQAGIKLTASLSHQINIKYVSCCIL